MSYHIVVDDMETAHWDILSYLSQEAPFRSAPRGKAIKEALGLSFELTNPRNRLISSPARAVNYGFAVGELCWYVRGEDDLETMLYYNKRMAQFSDDGKTINSAYGNRLFRGRWGDPSGITDVVSQLDMVIDELRKDPDSRRAVMHINEPADLLRAVSSGSKDVPCTMSLQLLVRDRRLHMHVLMRSNDAVWGMPYDVFSFTCLQEAFLYMLQEGGIPVDDLGSYHHTAGSLHLYETHYGMAEEVSKERLDSPPPMKPFTLDALQVLAHGDEPSIRGESWADVWACPTPAAHDDSIGWMYAQLCQHKNKRIVEARNKELNVVQSP
jgi:thymidylate synthase